MPKQKSSVLITLGIVLLFLGVISPLFARGPRWRRVDVGQFIISMQTIYAVDTNHIWASSYFGDVLYTKDGGYNWDSFVLGPVCCSPLEGGSIAKSFYFFDTLNGWIAGSANNGPPRAANFRLHTTDGGLSWKTQLDAGYKESGTILFLNRHKGFNLVGDGCSFKDSFLVTNDSGKTWRIQTTGIFSCAIGRFHFVDSTNGWGVFRYSPPVPGDTFGLMRTRDGGNNWVPIPVPSAFCFGARIAFIDTLNGWMAQCETLDQNATRLSRSTDGGMTWDSLYTFRNSYYFRSFQMLDVAHLWLGGGNDFSATVQFSSDGGRSWMEQMPAVGDPLASLYVLDTLHAYAAGENGYLYVYSPVVVGDLNLDWRLTPSDVVLLLNYIFLRRPTSVPPEDMDFNNDCSVTTADVVLLLNQVFTDSPQLEWGCAGT